MVLDKQRLSHGRAALQPIVLVRDSQRAQVLMRYGEGGLNRVVGSATQDAGRHWSAPSNTQLANPNAALSGVVLPDGTLLVVLNNSEVGRDVLMLMASRDGGASWRTLYTLEDQRAWLERSGTDGKAATEPAGAPVDAFKAAIKVLALQTEPGVDAQAFAESSTRQCSAQQCGFEFSYPYLLLTARGDLQLVYTWNRSFIKHVEFSRSWIGQRLKASMSGGNRDGKSDGNRGGKSGGKSIEQSFRQVRQ